MPQTQSKNRRRFERIPFEREAFILADDGTRPCELLDISFRGALVERNDEWQPSENQSIDLVIPLDSDDALRIAMRGTVVRINDHYVALRCDQMDIDSMTHLRRLVEMNLGDTDMLERELDAIID